MSIPLAPCAALDIGIDANGLYFVMPSGSVVYLSFPSAGLPSALAATKAMLQQANTALAPLTPLFLIIDCLVSVPDIVTDPTGFIEKLEKLAALFPPANIPTIVKSVIHLMLLFLQGTRNQILAFIAQQAALLAAATKAAHFGNARLQLAVDCGNAQLSAQIDAMRGGMQPINALVGILTDLLKLVPGAPTLPNLADLGHDMQAALAPLDAFIAALQAIYNAMP